MVSFLKFIVHYMCGLYGVAASSQHNQVLTFLNSQDRNQMFSEVPVPMLDCCAANLKFGCAYYYWSMFILNREQ